MLFLVIFATEVYLKKNMLVYLSCHPFIQILEADHVLVAELTIWVPFIFEPTLHLYLLISVH
jgi:hypothetical protein